MGGMGRGEGGERCADAVLDYEVWRGGYGVANAAGLLVCRSMNGVRNVARLDDDFRGNYWIPQKMTCVP